MTTNRSPEPPPSHRKLLSLTTDDAIIDGDLNAAAESITETASDILNVQRASIWLFGDERSHLECLDHYDRSTDTHDTPSPLPTASYPSYVAALESHRSIAADDARDDPRTAELRESYLEPNDIHSLLDATIRDEGEVTGVICHEATESPREWTQTEIELATELADIVYRAWRNHEKAAQRQQLAFQRSLLDAQQEAIPDALLVVDNNGDILSYNERFREFFDLSEELLETGSREDVLEAVVPQLANDEELDSILDRVTAAPDEPFNSGAELADGRVAESHMRPVEDEEGQQLGRLWLVRDITDRKERERELEMTYRAIEEAPIGITLSDATAADNPLVYVNDAFEALTGYEADEILGNNCRFLQGEATADAPVAAMRDAIDAQEPVTVELQNYRTDGTRFWNRVSIAPVADETGRVRNYVGFQQDVTDRKEANRQLRVLHRVLRHNLANQMTIIRGLAEQIAIQSTGAKKAQAETILSESDRLLSVTDTHREIVELLKRRPDPEPLYLGQLLEGAVEGARREYPEATITLDVDESVVVAAIQAVDRAVRELVTNAVEHSDQASPHVEVSVLTGDDSVTVRVADDGPGLPEEEAAILLGEQSVEPLYHGAGMGLWFVYWVMHLSGADLSCEERDGGGTVVAATFRRDGSSPNTPIDD